MDDISSEYRNTIQELKYFGSDYNKFLNKECSKEMTVNNIDCIQYKRSKKILRIVESKHSKEGGKDTQSELLKIIGKVFRFLNLIRNGLSTIFNNEFIITKFEIFKVYSDYPFEKAIIYDYIKNKEYTINNKKDLISWSGFDYELKEQQ
jgi:hypothetical protein